MKCAVYTESSRLIFARINGPNVLLQFTTARLITIYDSVLLQFAIAWLLQLLTTVITIYDRYITIHDINTIRLRHVGPAVVPQFETCGKRVKNSAPRV